MHELSDELLWQWEFQTRDAEFQEIRVYEDGDEQMSTFYLDINCSLTSSATPALAGGMNT